MIQTLKDAFNYVEMEKNLSNNVMMGTILMGMAVQEIVKYKVDILAQEEIQRVKIIATYTDLKEFKSN